MSLLDADQHAAARALIRSLADAAGDEPQVIAVLAASIHEHDIEHARALCAAALLVTFTECITAPATTDPAHPVPVTIPQEGDTP